MSTVDFGVRLIFDEDFYEIEIKKDPILLRKLMYINTRAQGYKRRFNVMSKKTFNKILNKNKTMPRELLRASFYDMEQEILEAIDDDIERTIKYAIHITEENPGKKSVILTSERKINEYSTNPHYNSTKDVSVKGGEEAIKLIDEFWKECTNR